MDWYLVHTKPRQETRAMENLERQGYECFFPTLNVEKLRRGKVAVVQEALFPRYLFIRLGHERDQLSWTPIRSTFGVSHLVSFGAQPARVEERLIDALKARSLTSQMEPEARFQPGERLLVCDGPFTGLEAIYQMSDGEQRVMVLIELLSKPVKLRIEAHQVKKAD